ncbi:MAG: oxidoreductase [Proteobacteria bacterium]|nr:oxidoreductase [Pseudomonadota bacterium]
MKIAFLGLGTMGLSMAANLIKAGYQVQGWNRSAGHFPAATPFPPMNKKAEATGLSPR